MLMRANDVKNIADAVNIEKRARRNAKIIGAVCRAVATVRDQVERAIEEAAGKGSKSTGFYLGIRRTDHGNYTGELFDILRNLLPDPIYGCEYCHEIHDAIQGVKHGTPWDEVYNAWHEMADKLVWDLETNGYDVSVRKNTYSSKQVETSVESLACNYLKISWE